MIGVSGCYKSHETTVASKSTESQIVAILKETNAGTKVAEVCRKHRISQPTNWNWKSKYGRLCISDPIRTKELEAELSKLKHMYADLALENDAIKSFLEKL